MSRNIKTELLGNIGKVCMCKRIMKEQTKDTGDIPFFKISTFGGTADCFIDREIFDKYVKEYSYPKKGDILISAAGTIGKTVIFDGEPSYFQDSNIVWVDNDESKLLNIYLYYFYKTNPRIKSTGSTILRLYNDNIRNIQVTFPESIEEQGKIAKVLSTIDDKIELNNKINSELEAMARELYEYWFVQFDFPDENGKPYKSSGGKMVWNEELKIEIPDGWSIEKIGNVADLYQPQTLSGNDLLENGRYFVYGANGIVGRYDEFNHSENEVAICCRGASCGNFLMTLPESWITGNAMVATPSSEKVTKEYLYYGLSYDRIAPFITGSAQPQITRTNLENLKVVIPNKYVLAKFDSLAIKIRKELQNIQYQNIQLSELRDFLLPMLMNGQVTVK